MTTNRVEVFTKIPDAVAILSSRGVYRQCEVYQLDGGVYARASGGFVRLHGDNGTSNGFRVHKIISNQQFGTDRLGRLQVNI